MSDAQNQPPTGTGTARPSDAKGRQYVPRPAPGYDDVSRAGKGPGGAVIGLTTLAAVLMMLSGVWGFLEGLAAIIRGGFFVVLPSYAYSTSPTSWGWIHLILGVLVFATGVALLGDALWARIAGIVLASFSAIANFLFIPYYPVWSIVLIAIDLLIIWALLAPRHDYA